MENEFAPHVQEIKMALDSRIEDNKIISDLKKLLEFRVPLIEAKRSIIKKYGGSEKSTIRKLKDILIGELNIEITGHIIEVNQKTIKTRDGEKIIFSGVICDETSSRTFTAWSDFHLAPGDVISVKQAYVRNWQERPELNFGPRSIVTKLNTKIRIPEDLTIKKLALLRDGDINVHTQFTVLSMESIDINTKDGPKKILSGIIADEDTKLPITAWSIKPELAAGNTIEVKNAYVRSFRGVPTLNLNESTIISIPEKKLEFREKYVMMIGENIIKDGAYDITVEGNILSIRPGSGLIARCPECARVVQKGVCRVHGKVEEVDDLRIKAIIDDGTGAMTLVLDAKLTQKICGISIQEAKKITQTAMSQKAVLDEIKKKLIGRRLSARGNMSKGEFGIILVAIDVRESPEMKKEHVNDLLGRIMGRYGKN